MSLAVLCCTAQELYSGGYIGLAGAATGFTVGPHVLMSLLLIVRQGWLAAASQAVGFILTLNPFENLTPIPQGIVGLFMLSIGFIAYVLIAASGEAWGAAVGGGGGCCGWGCCFEAGLGGAVALVLRRIPCCSWCRRQAGAHAHETQGVIWLV